MQPALRFVRLAGLFATVLMFTNATPAAPGLVCAVAAAPLGQDGSPAQREFSIAARRYAFSPDRIEVRQDDLVKIILRSEDIAHSFTIDDYRIARRVGAGQTTMFEFRADKPGVFPFYCNLTTEEGCRQMRGELIVQPR